MNALHTYALADGAQHPEVIFPLLESARVTYRSVYQTLLEDNLEACRLFLVDVPDLRADWVTQLDALDEQLPCLSFIKSALPAADLARHLRLHLIAEQENGQTLFVRYFDPRLLHDMLSVWDARLTRQLLTPIAAWIFRGCHTDWQTLDGYGQGKAPESYSPVTLSEADILAIQALSEPFAEMDALLGADGRPYAKKFSEFQQFRAQAQASGLHTADEIRDFVARRYRQRQHGER